MGVVTGLSGADAVALVQQYVNEPSLPSAAQVLIFLNRGVAEVTRRIGGIRLMASYPTVVNQTTITLNDDVLDVISCNFSLGNASSANTNNSSPFAQGALVYPMMQLDQASFMDAAAGFPAVGFGPPQAYLIYQDSGGAQYTLNPPVQPQLLPTSGTGSAQTIEVVNTYQNANGETTPSVVNDILLSATQQAIVLSPPGQGNATGYNTYAGNVGGPYYLQNTGGLTPIGTSFTIPGTLITTGNTPPTTNGATGSNSAGQISMQLYPAAMAGQVNVYYRARPQAWADTTSSSWTNLDSSAQEAVVLFAVMRLLNNRGRATEAKQLWQPEYEQMIADLKETIGRRATPKTGQVRDVRDRSFPSTPFWMT